MAVKKQDKQILDVYLREQLIGKLSSDQATLSFTYTQAYLQKTNALKLSAALPLQTHAFDHPTTYSFFAGLLPEGDVRHHLAKYLGLSEKNVFALLKEIGGECAGAVSVYPEDVLPVLTGKPSYRIFNDVELDEILSALDKHPLLAGEKGVRMSGAGAQDKLMIAFVDGKIAIPTNNTPSTHIIKPAIKRFEETVQNEYFCMELAKNLGLPVPAVDIYWLKNKAYYLIERYDRHAEENGTITRLHQEDFCQALHIPPEMKYENEGGPTLKQSFDLLGQRIQSGSMTGKNKIILLKGVIFNFLIGNGDAHAKNFSILYKEETESLAPFYDLLSTIIYSNPFKAKMAMKIGGHYAFRTVAMHHWDRLGEAIEFQPDFVRKQILILSNTIENAATMLAAELNKNPKTASPIYEKIINTIIRNCKQITGNTEN